MPENEQKEIIQRAIATKNAIQSAAKKAWIPTV
jgi:hypothetical protein